MVHARCTSSVEPLMTSVTVTCVPLGRASPSVTAGSSCTDPWKLICTLPVPLRLSGIGIYTDQVCPTASLML